jgi:hypothetical protein
MGSVSLLFVALVVGEPAWHTDYDRAVAQAQRDKKDLVIVFQDNGELDDVLKHSDVKKSLGRYVCLRLPTNYQYDGQRLLDHSALTDMMGSAGLAIVSYHDDKLPTHWQVISAHPLVSSRYRWAPSYGAEQAKITLDLPATATLSQRSMLYALRVHPEQPRSVEAELHPAFLAHAAEHSQRQASMNRQHHANLSAAMSRLGGHVPISGASEVVAESWGRFVGYENVLEASFACINAWRQSPGHWGAVSRSHRYFAYDIVRAGDGTWYATGIFAH